MKNIIDYWPTPEFTPRKNQETALEWLSTQTAKYLILEAPVGSGKSHIALTFARYLSNKSDNSSFILTPQLILQEQYERDFKNNGKKFLSSLRGKSNYKCKSKKTTCNIGAIVKPRCANCPFITAKTNAKSASNTVLNYKLALTSFTYTETFSKRKLMIMDEAHTLERHLVDFDACDITYARCKHHDIDFKVHTTLPAALDWVKNTYIPKIEAAFNHLEADSEYLFEKPGSEITKKDLNKLKELDELGAHVDDVLQMSVRSLEYLNENFVLVHDKTMFQFKRLSGEYSFNKIIKNTADKFLFMSSTILDKDEFCKELGIDPSEAAFISLDSDFPVANRPIYYMPVMKMNSSWKKPEQANGRKQMIQRVTALLKIHENDSGILHTANYQIAMWLVKELETNNTHTIYHHNPDDKVNRTTAIKSFLEHTTPSILISPSITEGLDLKNDLARFAITVKTPFGFLGDTWIKKRMEMSIEWYRRRAIIDIIQGGGRIVRNEHDEGTVYILDASFGYLHSQSIKILPKWWKESFNAI